MTNRESGPVSKHDYKALFEELAQLSYRLSSFLESGFPRCDQAVRDQERYEELLDIAGVKREG